ncbi:hairy/enhancer-of-split related with YRPW motif protein 1-like [Mizuhopecten yessoensis]|uniref:Hairy and enhancer of split-related protein HELT n=1 Tax=Mizuhopecten yessoensis TaxID=6573 RepID=A0A210PIC7_MIZYE|nr:hairy/enhancer-of-split related with YRPW motif protein 1-like [Mizuhopecten yessoensis]OWF36243.1 Hairy and enhancer of split-related protein HELT [Mizuhopecten yessoensis]
MAPKELKVTDQSSHKVIEKRRRDRINACLSELSQTVPAAFSKQNAGKLEKAEILEMTVEYLRAVQTTEIGTRFDHGEWYSSDVWADFVHHYQAGYDDCVREIVRYMTDVEGLQASDERCMRIISYLQTRFRADASVSGGSAYRDVLQRLTSLAKSRASLPVERSYRYAPYILPARDVTNSTPALLANMFSGSMSEDNNSRNIVTADIHSSSSRLSSPTLTRTARPEGRHHSSLPYFREK